MNSKYRHIHASRQWNYFLTWTAILLFLPQKSPKSLIFSSIHRLYAPSAMMYCHKNTHWEARRTVLCVVP